MSILPEPTPEGKAISQQLVGAIAATIRRAGGWISFAEYMQMALYEPSLGYYANDLAKFGDADAGGDFLTAPEITPLFAGALAEQIAQILGALPAPVLLEVGAGTGRLAADLLLALETKRRLPAQYAILEVSATLRARQEKTLRASVPHLLDHVIWLERLPERFSGLVLANEFLDALPTHAVAWRECGLMERGVAFDPQTGFLWKERPAPSHLSRIMAALAVAPYYESEVSLAARHWIAAWGTRLERGILLLIDYGLPAHELYHPQRQRGTLRCHYRQHTHENPFWWPGLSDITSHVDFTAVAESGYEAGLDVLGFTNQANFLIDCGLGELLAERMRRGGQQSLRAHAAVQMLISPAEMGELFKVIALGRNLHLPLIGFTRADRRHAL
ncbi:MAG: SAM-dependent methyltransferase [Rhodocyclaceae bacterium]|nr:SAM-dependent methyltransferase [Rhodocyclaceae bacterium]